MMDDREYVSGNEIARQWREMPHRKQADRIVNEMIHNHLSAEEVFALSGLPEHEFARMLAGDGAVTDVQYEALYTQIQLHRRDSVNDHN